MSDKTGLKCERTSPYYYECRAEWATEFSVHCPQPAFLSINKLEWEGLRMSCHRGARGDISNLSDVGALLDEHPHLLTGCAMLLIGLAAGALITRRRAAPRSPRL